MSISLERVINGIIINGYVGNSISIFITNKELEDTLIYTELRKEFTNLYNLLKSIEDKVKRNKGIEIFNEIEYLNNKLTENPEEETFGLTRSYGTYKYNVDIENNDIIGIGHDPLHYDRKMNFDKLTMECVFKVNNKLYIITIFGNGQYRLMDYRQLTDEEY